MKSHEIFRHKYLGFTTLFFFFNFFSFFNFLKIRKSTDLEIYFSYKANKAEPEPDMDAYTAPLS